MMNKIWITVEPVNSWEAWEFGLTSGQYHSLENMTSLKEKMDYLHEIIDEGVAYEVTDSGVEDGYRVVDIDSISAPEPEIEVPEWWSEAYKDLSQVLPPVHLKNVLEFLKEKKND